MKCHDQTTETGMLGEGEACGPVADQEFGANSERAETLGLGPTGGSRLPPPVELLPNEETEEAALAPASSSRMRKEGDTGPDGSADVDTEGLASDLCVTDFVDAVRALQLDWPKLDVAGRADRLVSAANGQLEAIEVPAVAHEVAKLSVAGQFDSERWLMQIGEKKPFSSADLDDTAASSLGATVYHEARHAEQAFRVARHLAGSGRGAAEIAAQLGIPVEIAASAAERPLSASGESDPAADWYAAESDAGRQLADATYTELDQWRALSRSRWAALEAAQRNYQGLTEQQGVDAAMLQSAEADWRSAYDEWKAVSDAYRAIRKRYQALPREQDAWMVDALVRSEFGG